ncbi:JNK1/MAPK8-associated membrane protein [Lamellibrachia satsuma]|nr:JNK1/MAPK8-associated membrane protein [Lamellibrachia satsuma]
MISNAIFALAVAFFITPVSPFRVVRTSTWCPGLYCGRTLVNRGNASDCGACVRGARPDEDSVCHTCTSSPNLYDSLYLGFMAMSAPTLHWFFIDFTNKRKSCNLLILHASSLVESAIAAICTLLVVTPIGSLLVTSCKVKALSDWYTMFYNPSPDYVHTINCTQEAVYPLYTMVLIYYAFGIVAMMLFRPLLAAKFVPRRGTKSIYAALYMFPILAVVHATCAGLIYYAFPYIVLVISLVTSALHFALFTDQGALYLLRENFLNARNLTIVVCHWALHAYGIIAITQLQIPSFHAPMLCLVPFPAVFYLLTVRFTDPDNLDKA